MVLGVIGFSKPFVGLLALKISMYEQRAELEIYKMSLKLFSEDLWSR